jgi:hypothetical protein
VMVIEATSVACAERRLGFRNSMRKRYVMSNTMGNLASSRCRSKKLIVKFSSLLARRCSNSHLRLRMPCQTDSSCIRFCFGLAHSAFCGKRHALHDIPVSTVIALMTACASKRYPFSEHSFTVQACNLSFALVFSGKLHLKHAANSAA